MEARSRELPGVIHFDVTRSLTDPYTFVVIEVFEDRQALERQEGQGEVAAVMSLIAAGALTRDLEWTGWETSSTEWSDSGASVMPRPVGDPRSNLQMTPGLPTIVSGHPAIRVGRHFRLSAYRDWTS